MASRFDLQYLRHHEHRSQLGWLMLRLTVAGIIAAHGWTRVFNGGVLPFGEFLNGHGFVIGTALAMLVTGSEIIGSVLLILGKLVTPLGLLFAFIYGMGIVLVHAREGWFVVGPGSGGAEYSVLLIVSFLALALHHYPQARLRLVKSDQHSSGKQGSQR